MNEQLRRVAHITNEQHGAVTTSQMRAAGMTDAERRRRVRSGVLVPSGTHTFRSHFAPSTMLSELAAAVLDCGASAVASGPSAAAVHGFDGFRLRRPLHVMVGRGRNVQRAHLHVHTTSELPLIDRARVEGVATLSPPAP